MQADWIAGNPISGEMKVTYERKLNRAMNLVKRAEQGVQIYPRELRRLAVKAGVGQSSLFETALNKSPAIKQPAVFKHNLSTQYLVTNSPKQWPPYRPPSGRIKKASPAAASSKRIIPVVA